MARKLRIEYPGAIYHVMNRGDRREPIFKDDQDRRGFLAALGETCEKTRWQVHAWCLMPNHFHLVIETPQGNLVAGMKWLLGTYTSRFNRRYKLFGHLFSGRYKSLIVDGSGNGYLKSVCDYVHLNPARAKMLSPERHLGSYRWSSMMWYLQPRRKRPSWLRVERLLGEHGIPGDTKEGRREFGRRMELRRRAEDDPKQLKALRRGWCLGTEEFRKELLVQMAERIGENHYGEERAQSEGERAEQIVQERLRRFGWKEADLERRAKGDPKKVKLAVQLRSETGATIKWIAERLKMGTSTHVNHLLYWHRRKAK
ncbi:MAG TPA: transposase [Verrucomicrobiae bacterium]|nr:transposase [Verrucomicrobiae bacterium]